jgi:CubicO group peptidase (beta-lactamase class C family)
MPAMLRQSLAAAAMLALSGCALWQGQPPAPAPEFAPGPDIAARVTQVLRGFTDSGRLVGASALVTQDGREIYFGAFGYGDREADRAMARDTIVSIYSMTKPVTGVALMMLWEQGKFRLDDPVAKYIPELANVQVYSGVDASGRLLLAPPIRAMTVRDLVRHTAGLTNGEGGDIPAIRAMARAVEPMALNRSLDEFVARLGSLPLEYQPGERWRYSCAVDVQALLVQRLSGMAFARFVQEKIFDPLRMRDTGFFVPPEKRARMAAMYRWRGEAQFDQVTDDRSTRLNTAHWALTPGGYGLTSTLDDYTRFARMLLGGGELDGVRLLSPATVRMMTTSMLDPAVRERSWLPGKGEVGFGVDLAVRIAPATAPGGAAGAVGEYFWDGAANTLFWVDPKNRLTAVFFTQYMPFGAVPAHKALRDAVYGAVDPSALAPP